MMLPRPIGGTVLVNTFLTPATCTRIQAGCF